MPLLSVMRSAIRLVWSAARREFVILAGTQIVSALALVAQLYLARQVLIEVTADEGFESFDVLGPVLVMLVLVRIVVALSSAARSELRVLANIRVRRAAARELYEVAAAVELAAYDDSDFHDRLRRAFDNTSGRIWSSVWSLVALSSAIVTLIALVAVLVVVAPLVLGLAVIGAIPLWWVRRRNNQAEYRLAYEYTDEDRERTYLEGMIVSRAAAGEVRSYGLGGTLIGRIDRLYRLRLDRTRDLVRRRIVWTGAATVISNVVAVGAVAVLAQLMINGNLSIADGGVALIALQQAAGRLSSLSDSVGGLMGSALFLEDYESFVRHELPAADAEVVEANGLRSARLEKVTFTYPGMSEPVLRGVDLHVERGELIALVGENGSGKSTVAKLLAGLYAVEEGSITWETADGPIDDPRRVRRMVGLVFQHFLRFELTARDNVTFGDHSEDESTERAWAALEQAGIADVIRGLPEGLDSRLGRSFANGSELSAGQWQRIGIARAFFRNAPLLILDEPTAAVDAKAEEELFDTVRSLQEGRAVVLITHRMATVRGADRIYVLDDGAIVEVGTHDELIESAGHYAFLYEVQARAYRDE
ncbi:MAG: ATP-binding cassette subfamily B protein [Candidatus Aldehydirespiratoraceae bacterium]|jgi:ATP-binding cassette subfamily B protein